MVPSGDACGTGPHGRVSGPCSIFPLLTIPLTACWMSSTLYSGNAVTVSLSYGSLPTGKPVVWLLSSLLSEFNQPREASRPVTHTPTSSPPHRLFPPVSNSSVVSVRRLFSRIAFAELFTAAPYCALCVCSGSLISQARKGGVRFRSTWMYFYQDRLIGGGLCRAHRHASYEFYPLVQPLTTLCDPVFLYPPLTKRLILPLLLAKAHRPALHAPCSRP